MNSFSVSFMVVRATHVGLVTIRDSGAGDTDAVSSQGSKAQLPAARILLFVIMPAVLFLPGDPTGSEHFSRLRPTAVPSGEPASGICIQRLILCLECIEKRRQQLLLLEGFIRIPVKIHLPQRII